MLYLLEDLGAHYLNLEFSEQFLSEDEANVHLELPYPVHKPLKHAGIDLVGKYHKDVAQYNEWLSTARREFQLTKDKIVKQDFAKTHVSITKNLLEFCQKDKQQMLYVCDYNPYYATGCLEYCCLGDDSFLLRPDSQHNLRYTRLRKLRKSAKLHLEPSIEEQPILGLAHISQSTDLKILLRQKFRLNLLKVTDLRDTAELCLTRTFDRAILDAKLSQFENSTLSVVFDDLELSLYDIARNKNISTKKYAIESALKSDFVAPNSLAVMSQNSLKVLDLRSAENGQIFKPQLDACNTFCAFQVSDDNSLYVASRHFLLRSDLRNLQNVEYCSHVLKTSPCFMSLDRDFLCLAGQNVEDKVVFCGQPVDSLPIGVPSILDTLKECRLNRDVCLKPHVEQRARLSTVGVRILNGNDGSYLYSSNVLGEIFRQKILTTATDSSSQGHNIEREESRQSIDALYDWINHLPPPPKPLRLTNVVNASVPFFNLEGTVPQEKLMKYKKSKKVAPFLSRFQGQYQTNNLGDLAANFARIWDDDEDDEALLENVTGKAVDGEDVDMVPEVAPLDKVNSWIQSSHFDE